MWTMFKPAYDPTTNPIVVAAAKNQVPVLPRENELQLDLDTDEQFARFKEGLDLLMQLGVKASYSCTPSKTAGHKHVTVALDVTLETPMERILLQAALGSDPRREIYSWYRARLKSHITTVFFENEPAGK